MLHVVKRVARVTIVVCNLSIVCSPLRCHSLECLECICAVIYDVISSVTVQCTAAGGAGAPLSHTYGSIFPTRVCVISSQEALAHPYLNDLHSRAREPCSDTTFDWRYEVDYPNEMPKQLLQKHMFSEMMQLRAEMHALGFKPVAAVEHTASTASSPDDPMALGGGAEPPVNQV